MRAPLALVLVACSSHHGAALDAPACGGCDAPNLDAPINAAPTLVSSFAGEVGASGTAACGRAGGTNCAYRDHADATIASNGTYVVEVTGQSLTVYDAATGNQVKRTALATLLTAAGGTAAKINDPYVDWNEFAGRWIVSIPTLSQDFLAVSATSDPSGMWSGVALTATNVGDVTMKLAHDANGEYIGEFANDGLGSPDPNTQNIAWYCFAIPRAELAYTGSFAPAHKNQANCAYEARPVMDHDPTKPPTAPFFFVGRDCVSGTCQNATNAALGVIVHQGTWSGATATLDSRGQGGGDRIVASGFIYNTPIGAAQPTAPAFAGTESHRVFAAEQAGARLHAVIASGPCTASCGAQGADANDLFFYVAVDVSAYPALALAGSVKVASSTLGLTFPALATDGNGNVGIASACTGPAQDASVCAWSYGAAGLLGPTVLVPGTQVYNCNGGATVGGGTYANVVRDGVDATRLWSVTQDAESATSCQWTTRIAQFRI